MPSALQTFSGSIYKVGLIRYVDVPPEISRALKAARAHLPVCGSVEGLPFRTTMVSRGNRCHRVAIHGDLRKRLCLDSGATVEIALRRDEKSREPALPPALVLALRQSPPAQKHFRDMTTALRRQIVRYLTTAKQQSTLERRVAGLVRSLEQKAMEKARKKRALGRDSA